MDCIRKAMAPLLMSMSMSMGCTIQDQEDHLSAMVITKTNINTSFMHLPVVVVVVCPPTVPTFVLLTHMECPPEAHLGVVLVLKRQHLSTELTLALALVLRGEVRATIRTARLWRSVCIGPSKFLTSKWIPCFLRREFSVNQMNGGSIKIRTHISTLGPSVARLSRAVHGFVDYTVGGPSHIVRDLGWLAATVWTVGPDQLPTVDGILGSHERHYRQLWPPRQ
jgi:hypothetical protein